MKRQLPDFRGDSKLEEILFSGEIVYTADKEQSEVIANSLLRSLPLICIIGFDLEWRVSWKKGAPQPPTALIQICCSEQICFLFHSTFCDVPPSLRLLLESASIFKVGVNVTGDIRKIKRDFDIDVLGAVEISDLANCLLPKNAPYLRSLSNFCEFLLHKQISKDSKVRTCNWEHYNLSKEQILYAATDAYVSLAIVASLIKQSISSYLVPSDSDSTLFDSLIAARHTKLSKNKIKEEQDVDLEEEQNEDVEPKQDENEQKTGSNTDIHADIKTHIREAYSLFMDEGYSFEDIARIRNIQINTAKNYVAEALEAGMALPPFDRFGIPSDHILAIERDLSTNGVSRRLRLIKDNLDNEIEYASIRLVLVYFRNQLL